MKLWIGLGFLGVLGVGGVEWIVLFFRPMAYGKQHNSFISRDYSTLPFKILHFSLCFIHFHTV